MVCQNHDRVKTTADLAVQPQARSGWGFILGFCMKGLRQIFKETFRKVDFSRQGQSIPAYMRYDEAFSKL